MQIEIIKIFVQFTKGTLNNTSEYKIIKDKIMGLPLSKK